MIRSLGVNTDNITVWDLGSRTPLCPVWLARCPGSGFADIGMGIGMIVAALAAIISGRPSSEKQRSRDDPGTIVGSVIYKFIIAIGLDWD